MPKVSTTKSERARMEYRGGCWTYDDAENEDYDSDMHVHYLRKLALAPLEYNKSKILEREIKVNGKDASC